MSKTNITPNLNDDFKELSSRMVDEQLVTRGIKSPSVLEAMRNVPRCMFVPESLRDYAYDDSPLPIGFGQTISQPYIVAYMTEQLSPFSDMKVLEIGTGSGYQAAILAYLGCSVYTIELLESLATEASEVFSALGFSNIHAKHGDGYLGWQENAPFDAIIVTAAPEAVPEELISQLGENSKMIIPTGSEGGTQVLKLLERKQGETYEQDMLYVRFVPMVKP